MSSLGTTERFKSEDAASYDPVSEHFARFSERLSAPLAQRIVALAQLSPGARVLDVGTGTGIVALAAAEAVGEGGRVVGIDLSDGMLLTARRYAERAGLAGRVDFHCMDAESLEISDSSFDAVVSLFALLHFPNPSVALKEMRRVLRPGGQLVLGIGGAPPVLSRAGLVHGFRRLFELAQRLRGRRLEAPAFLNALVERHLPRRDAEEETELAKHHMGRGSGVAALVEAAGFEDVRTCWEGYQTVLDTPEEFWDLQRTFSSIARKRMASVPQHQIDALRKKFLARAAAVQSRGGRLVYPVGTFFVAAVRP